MIDHLATRPTRDWWDQAIRRELTYLIFQIRHHQDPEKTRRRLESLTSMKSRP